MTNLKPKDETNQKQNDNVVDITELLKSRRKRRHPDNRGHEDFDTLIDLKREKKVKE